MDLLKGVLPIFVVVGSLGVTALVCLVALSRTRREPRRLSNAFWLLAGGMLLVGALGAVGAPGAETLGALLALPIFLAPILVLVLSAFLVLNGLVMLKRESRTLGNMLSLIAGLGLVALTLSPLLVLVLPRLWLVIALMVVLLAAAYFGFIFLGFLGYSWLYPRLVARRSVDWVVVLGSGLVGGRRVPPLLASRIRAGIAAHARFRARVLIMSGGKGSDEQISEAEAMGEWATEQGADPSSLWLENQSRTTEQNLRLTIQLVEQRWSSLPVLDSTTTPALGASPPVTDRRGAEVRPEGLIITSNYHVLRAAILARRLGVPAQAAGCPTAGYYWPSAMLREFVAILVERRRLHAALVALVALPVPAAVTAVAVVSGRFF